jgi:DNA-binding Lrp family transcriptional regulator
MVLSAADRRLLAAIEEGLPLVEAPYAAIGAKTGLRESEVIARLRRLIADGVIRRFGVMVRHRELGYGANAMVVWDVPDARVSEVGRTLAGLPFVTLCYRRPRRLPVWPYNLFCMIHGRERGAVEALVETASVAAGLEGLPRAVLFSRRRFKQRGARYAQERLQELA